jgi:hypothetical protein
MEVKLSDGHLLVRRIFKGGRHNHVNVPALNNSLTELRDTFPMAMTTIAP